VEKARNHDYHFLIVLPGCGGGDWPPLLALAEGLHRSGHDLVVVCDGSTVEAVKSSGLKPLLLPDSLDLAKVFEPAVSRLLSGQEELVGEGQNPFMAWGHCCVDFIVKSLKEWRPSMVITSLFGLGLGETLSKVLAAPRCFLNPSFSFGCCRDYDWDADFSEVAARMYRFWFLPLVQSAQLVFHATDMDFDLCSGVPVPHQGHVGPMFWEMAGVRHSMLQRPGPPWVLITLSTSPQPGDMTIVETALKSLESMDVRVLVTLAPGHDKSALGAIPDNVHMTGYIPHSQVLPHCHLVISHAGHGIVMKAMVHGVPMVLVPWGRDQPGVAARAKKMDIAAVIPRQEFCSGALTEAIKKILSDSNYLERSRKLSYRMRKIDTVTGTVTHIEQFLKIGCID
jgi:UDP:flavonoid glycosyltransferase YjiC (YdhE family)